MSKTSDDLPIGLFGGAFDPPHMGHVRMAEYVLQQKSVAEVWVIPCFAHPFHKQMADYAQRLAMCGLAFSGCDARVKVSDVERAIGGVSYSIRTVEQLKKEFPHRRFAWIMGSDTPADFSGWRDAEQLLELCTPIVIPRGLHSPVPSISATQVRANVRSGTSITDLVPPAVEEYIRTHKLYRT